MPTTILPRRPTSERGTVSSPTRRTRPRCPRRLRKRRGAPGCRAPAAPRRPPPSSARWRPRRRPAVFHWGCSRLGRFWGWLVAVWGGLGVDGGERIVCWWGSKPHTQNPIRKTLNPRPCSPARLALQPRRAHVDDSPQRRPAAPLDPTPQTKKHRATRMPKPRRRARHPPSTTACARTTSPPTSARALT
jgi:hypothetical protein